MTLNDGTPGVVRPIDPSDRDALVAGFEALSPESRLRRFFYNKKKLSEDELSRLTHPDGIEHIGYGLLVQPEGEPEEIPIAVARCFRDKHERDLAEIAVVTADGTPESPAWMGVNARGFNSAFNPKNLQINDSRLSSLIATGLPRLTAIEDEVSRAVRASTSPIARCRKRPRTPPQT